MLVNKKKIFPKVKKKIKGFLTDESGKITKKDALLLSAGVVLLAGIDSVDAGKHDSHSNRNSGHFSQDNVNYDTGHSNISVYGGHGSLNGDSTCSPVNVSHTSGIINGHYSGTPAVSGGNHSNNVTHSNGPAVLYGHGSHGSHGSHCSGCAACANW